MADRDLLDLARDVALEAAELVAARRAGRVEVADTKTSSTDVVTEADRAAEELIYDHLTRARPGDGFLGEEGASAESSTGVTWVVDPIDGTVNFLYDIPQYAVSIAAERDGNTVAGVVVDVAGGEVFTGLRGGGAYVDGRRLRVREVVPLDQRLVATGFSYVPQTRTVQAAAVGRLLSSVRDVRRLGSAALDLCMVAAGRVDGYVEEGVQPWDVAAAALIAEEAGATIGACRGASGHTCVIAAPTAGFAEFEELARDCGFFADDGE
jgi:myo-inositol-1(or 4)-monophosphatase